VFLLPKVWLGSTHASFLNRTGQPSASSFRESCVSAVTVYITSKNRLSDNLTTEYFASVHGHVRTRHVGYSITRLTYRKRCSLYMSVSIGNLNRIRREYTGCP